MSNTIRENADNLTQGIQTTAFVTDGAGVPTSYSDNLLQFNGDGRYVDTGFMPPSDKAWEIDFVMETKADGTRYNSGLVSSTVPEARLQIGQHINNGLYGYIGSSLIGAPSAAVADGLHYIRIEFDGAGNGNFVIDNTAIYSFSLSAYTYSATQSFFIGITSLDGVPTYDPLYNATGTFQYTARTRTADERNAYHAKLKTIYPTLP